MIVLTNSADDFFECLNVNNQNVEQGQSAAHVKKPSMWCQIVYLFNVY